MSSQNYSKLKLKYFNYQKFMSGSGNDKYVLLSCPEFDNIVDSLINIDGNLTYKSDDITSSTSDLDGSLKETLDGVLDDSNFPETFDYYQQFLKEIGSNYKEANLNNTNKLKYRKLFLRKKYDFSSKNFYRGFINWKTYNDKTPDIKMSYNTVNELRGGKVIYFAYFSFNEDKATPIINQLLFLNSLNHYGVSEINIVLPYFPVGTMERIVGEGEIPTAYSLTHILNNIPSGASKNNIYIFDIHALCSRFFFHTQSRPILVSMMSNFLNVIKDRFNKKEDNNIIVFPDDGAKKRFEKLLPPGTKTITCSKERKGDQRIIKIDSGLNHIENPENNRLLIDGCINLFVIDDLVQSGGTLLETFNGLGEILKKYINFDPNNIRNIPVVTHSVFPGTTNIENFFKPENNIHMLITTNSRPLKTKEMLDKYNDKIIVIDIAISLHRIFTKQDDNEYIAPYSIN
jgi:phosphoribosylpyrophosphate synthetase